MPNRVKNLKITHPSSATVKATWDCGLKNVKEYHITLYTSSGTKNKKGNLVWSKIGTIATTKKNVLLSLPAKSIYKVKISVKPVPSAKASWKSSSWVSKTRKMLYSPNPATASAPTVYAVYSEKDVRMYAEQTNNSGATHVQFQIFLGETGNVVAKSPECAIKDGRASWKCTKGLSSGNNYRARCRYVKKVTFGSTKSSKFFYGAWGPYSSSFAIKPSVTNANKPSVSILNEDDDGMVLKIKWTKANGASKGYDIQYSNSYNYFIEGENIISTAAANVNELITSPISYTGDKLYFRLRAKNDAGESKWTGTLGKPSTYGVLIAAKQPDPPTTYTLKDVGIIGEEEIIKLYFTHNATDNGDMKSAKVELTYDGTSRIYYYSSASDKKYFKNSDDIWWFEMPTAGYSDASEIKWRVATAGALMRNNYYVYSDWSVQRSVYTYIRPTVEIDITDRVTTYPLAMNVRTSPTSQTPIVTTVTVSSEDSYVTTNEVGEDTYILPGDVVCSKLIYNSGNEFTVELGIEDVVFNNGSRYTINVLVSMNSGLDAVDSTSILAVLEYSKFECTADVDVDTDNLIATINPYCYDYVYQIANSYVVADPQPTEYEYSVSPYLYYLYDEETDSYEQCASFDKYSQNNKYYVVGLNSFEFDKRKTLFYKFDNESGLYTQCTNDEIFDEDLTYYKPHKFYDHMNQLFDNNKQDYYMIDYNQCVDDYYENKTGYEFDSTVLYFSKEYTDSIQPTTDTWNDGAGWYVKLQTETDLDYLEMINEEFDSSITYYTFVGYTNSIQPTNESWYDGVYWFIFVEGSIYDSAETYYVLENDVYVIAYPTESEFDFNKSSYYIVDYKQCSEEDMYEPERIYYIPDDYSYMEPQPSDIEFYGSANKFYILVDGAFKRCTFETAFEAGPFYIPISFQDAKEQFFIKNKTFYYVFNNNKYIQCNDTDEYVPNYIYYRPPENMEYGLSEDTVLTIFRREYDGSFTKIEDGIPNDGSTSVIDIHPALDYARYRIVAYQATTGSTGYGDSPDVKVGEKALVMQWDDRWENLNVINDDEGTYDQTDRIVSMLKLPYNISISEQTSIDVSLVEYIGRAHPVSYYGTQLGTSMTWTTEIPKYDVETLYQLRRLSVWKGDVYVREPSGIGYWSNVTVSMSKSYSNMVIPVNISITRVDGDEK